MINTTIINATRARGRSMLHIPPTNHHLPAHSLNKNYWRVIWKKRIRQKEQLDEGEDADKRGDRKMESNHSPGIPDRVAEREMESSDSPGIPHRMMAGWGVGGVTSDILSLLSVPPVSITSANRATKPGHRPWSWISDLNLTPCKKMPLLEVL